MSSRKKIFNEFVDTTSINGLQRICVKNPIRRHIWIFIIVVAFFCFGVHFYFSIEEYLKEPTNTESKILENNFEFPDVTICAKKPFDSKKGNKSDLGIDQASRFWRYALQNEKNFSETAKDEIAFRHAKYSFIASNKHDDFYMDILQHIHYCCYNYAPCDVNDFSIIHLPDRLNCITFHPNQRNLKSSGKDYGLNILIDTGASFGILSAIEEIMMYDGFELTIHENRTLPDTLHQTFTIQKGKANDVGLTMSIYKQEKRKNNQCLDELESRNFSLNIHGNNQFFIEFNRSRAICRIENDQYKAVRKCGCWRDDEIIPWNKNETFNPVDYPLCHSLPEHFYYNEKIFANGSLLYKGKLYQLNENNKDFTKVKQRASCLNKLRHKFTSSGHIENCEHPCEKKLYFTQFSSNDYKLNFSQFVNLYEEFFFNYRIKGQMHLNTSDFAEMSRELDEGKKLMRVSIYATDLDVISTRESLAYPLSALFSDFGGNIGLWIGCTVITLAEILELILRLIFERVNNEKKNSKFEDESMMNLRTETVNSM